MQLFWSLLPLYLLGNLHCLGMCGPLVAFLSKHQGRNLYLWGRFTSFTLAGAIAGALGELLSHTLNQFFIGTLLTLLAGLAMILFGIYSFLDYHMPNSQWLNQKLEPLGKEIAKLSLHPHPMALFGVGMASLLLPCGQTLVVFSACALEGNLLSGVVNGAAFALFTSPSLWLAAKAPQYLIKWRPYNRYGTALSLCLVGTLTLCRVLADYDYIDHIGFHLQNYEWLHIAFY